jgi:hypothetical protein
MPTLTRSLPALVALALAACGGEPPPPPPVFVADSVADTLVVPVVDVATAVPRSDGSWALLAPMEGEIHVADFAADTVTLHAGISKEEVPGATALMHVGDTIVVGDWGLRRFTSWVPDGRRVDAVPTPEPLRGAFPRARDAAGQWYFELLPNPGRDGSGNLDSLAIVRSDALLTRFDTVAKLAPIDHAEVERDGAMRWEAMPLAGRDYWGVQPDGTVWIVRRMRNFVEWLPPGGGEAVRSPGLPDPVYTVEEMDRQIWLRRYEEVYRTQVRGVRFAMIKPPVEGAFAGAEGRLWLFKSAPALDSVRSFQVVDSTGVRAVVQVPSRGKALGITATHILMGEEFPEGIRLLRYRMPEGL